ncbi:MAG: hypothetical protein IKN65_00940 [Clostridia bacterium]|nr:hypothetical protein [Clostridia bacterium]
MNNYFIKILDKTSNKTWQEDFNNYEEFRKRFYRLKYSKKLIVISRSLLEGEV